MSKRFITYKTNEYIHLCPGCKNNTKFVIRSEQVAEDCCEIWVVCGVCDFDPTHDNTNDRLEDVWGGVADDNAQDAINLVWNELVPEIQK